MEEVLDPNGKVIGPRGAKGFKRWVPKEWKPIYEAIVALSCTGLDNEEVGKRFGYGKQQISNILNTPQAKKIRAQILERLSNENTQTVVDRMANLNEAALKHIEYVLDRPSEEFKNPLAIFDRSVKWLSGNGILKPENPNQPGVVNNTNIHAMILNQEATARITDGLHRANEVKVIHGSKSET